VSKFILNAYDFGDATAPESSLAPAAPPANVGDDELPATQNRERASSLSGPHNAPYLSELD
jgi:hypothetical protein